MLKSRTLALFAFYTVLGLASAASAQTFPAGGGTLVGGERLRVPGCGRLGGAVSLDVALAANGAWTIDSGTDVYSGTSNALTRRLVLLTPDAASLAALEAELEQNASALCEEPVEISALNVNAALKLNKRQDRARLFVRARGTGTTESGDQGSGLYRLRAGGAWNPDNA